MCVCVRVSFADVVFFISFLQSFKCNVIQSVSVQCSFSSFTPNENKKENKNKRNIY